MLTASSQNSGFSLYFTPYCSHSSLVRNWAGLVIWKGFKTLSTIYFLIRLNSSKIRTVERYPNASSLATTTTKELPLWKVTSISFAFVVIFDISLRRFSDFGISSFCILSFTINAACFLVPLATTIFVLG